MKNMSFSITKDQFRNRNKNITRRLGWKCLKPNTHLMGVEKAQGLKKGEKIKKMGEIIIIKTGWEPLDEIINRPIRFEDQFADDPIGCGLYQFGLVPETYREGFPNLTPEEFVEIFCKANKCQPETLINRIGYKYV